MLNEYLRPVCLTRTVSGLSSGSDFDALQTSEYRLHAMSCYVDKIRAPSRREFDLWKSIGYLGDYEAYAASKEGHVGSTMFICGDLGGHCADCAGFDDFLCDYPVGDGKTCDRPMCVDHAHEIAPEIHYCDGHHKMWTEFKNRGGVDDVLRNVVAFKSEK